MKYLKLTLILACLAGAAFAQVNVIYDDDCGADPDCGTNLATLHKLADFGEIRILATMANSANPLSAPAMKVYNTYYGRPSTPVGAYQGSTPNSTSTWLAGLIAAFDSGDTRANYTDCVTQYRTVLAAQPNSSVVIVETGFMTCLNGLLQSAADGISPLTGVQLIKAKVTQLYVMGGDYPSSAGEFNFVNDKPDAAAVCSTWTTQNGYPPIWFDGLGINGNNYSGPPLFASVTVNPVAKAFSLYGCLPSTGALTSCTSGVWDQVAIWLAARGLSYGGTTYFTLSANGTNTVNASTGANTWSSGTASGHYYVTSACGTSCFSALFDGTALFFGGQQVANAGFAGMAPYVGKGAAMQ
jgi:hypothetical protein